MLLKYPPSAEEGFFGREVPEGRADQRIGAALIWIGIGLFLCGLTFLQGAAQPGVDQLLGVAGVVVLVAGLVLGAYGLFRLRRRPTRPLELEGD